MPELNAEIDELIAKLIAGEATPEEASEVDDWLDNSADNRRYFADLQHIWQHAGAGRPASAYTVDTEAALQKIKSCLHASQTQPGRRMPLWAVAAAAAFAGLMITYFLMRAPQASPAVQIAATDTVRTDTLRDGSVVALNRHSDLTLTPGFGHKERRLQLHGTAHFAVAHDARLPFVIEVQALEIRVVGTEFTVDNSSRPEATTVTVDNGIVSLRSGDQTLQLTAGQQATFEKGLIRFDSKPDVNADAWRNLDFRFEATPLSEVVRSLEAAYGIQIKLNNEQLGRCPLTGHYSGEQAQRVLELIADTFSLSLSREGDAFVLDGAACIE